MTTSLVFLVEIFILHWLALLNSSWSILEGCFSYLLLAPRHLRGILFGRLRPDLYPKLIFFTKLITISMIVVYRLRLRLPFCFMPIVTRIFYVCTNIIFLVEIPITFFYFWLLKGYLFLLLFSLGYCIIWKMLSLIPWLLQNPCLLSGRLICPIDFPLFKVLL